jgi:hypothetical protein
MPVGWDDMADRARRAAQERMAKRQQDRQRAERLVRDMFSDPEKRPTPPTFQPPIRTGNTSMENIEEATAALAGIASATMDQINHLGLYKAGIEEDAAAISASKASLEVLAAEMADQVSMTEQTQAIVEEIREYVEGLAELNAANGQTATADRCAAALEEIERVKEAAQVAQDATERLKNELTVPIQMAADLSEDLAGRAEQTDDVRARMSQVRHESDSAQVAVDAIDG